MLFALCASLALAFYPPSSAAHADTSPAIAFGESLYSGVFGPNTWNPSIDWDTSDTCEYSYDSIEYLSADCGAGGADILAPEMDGETTIFIRGTSGSASSDIAVGFIYDSVAPSVFIDRPLSGDEIRESDWGTGVQVYWDDAFTCEYSYDGESYLDAGGCSYETGIPAPAVGPATLYVRGIDEAGNIGEDSISFSYEADVSGCMDPGASNYNADANIDDECTYPDIDPPSISITSPYEGEFVGAFSAFVEWDDAVSCRYAYDSGDPTYIPCNNDGGIAAPETSGEHTLTVYGDDDSENEASASVTFTYSPEPLFAEDNGAFSDISENAAIVDYSLLTQGSSGVTRIDVVYDTDAAYTDSEGAYGQSVVFEAEAFSDSGAMNLDGLACETLYHFAFVAYNADYSATSSDSTFTTGTCPPAEISISAPSEGQMTSWWPPSIDWDTSTTCEYSFDDETWQSVACESDLDAAQPSDGDYTLYARGSSDDGATWSSASVSFTLDTAGPVVSISAPAESGTVAPGAFAATVDWGDSTACIYSYDGFGNYRSVDCAQAGTDIPAPVTSGETTLSVQGTDAAGNHTQASVTFTMEEDAEAPTVSLTAPLNGSTHLRGELVTLSADANDNAGIDEVRFYVNGVAIYPDTGAPYTFDWNTSATSTGTKTVVAVAKDISGNYATSSPATFTLEDFEGSGTSGDPYLIEECFQFATMNDYLDASYILANDLDCSGIEDGVMIGTPDTPFTGTFDGDGHTVTILMSVTGEDEIGLFRETDGATIRDINIIAQILGGAMTGSLVGLAQDTTIINASSTAIVVGLGGLSSPPYVGTGGIIGALIGGGILGSHFEGQMLGYIAVGGIAGTASNDALISRSWNSGQVFGGAGVGGIVGYLMMGSQVRNSYSDGPVTFYESLREGLPVSGAFGGIAGILSGATISRSYATGSVGGNDVDYPSGGLVGINQGDSLIAYSFAAADMVGGEGDVAGVLGGSLGGTLTLTGNAFDPSAAGVDVCRLDTPDDFTGCEPADTDGDSPYWKDTEHMPLDHFNGADVWDFTQPGDYPLLRTYAGPEPAESDDPESEPEEDPDSESAPAASSGGGGIAGFIGTIGPYRGFGYIAPRPQIIFPDGRVVYLDVPDDAPAPAADAPQTYAFTRTLKLGMSGEDVRELQRYLNAHGFVIAASGPGSPGSETTYFGALTKAALIRFQEAHAKEILAPVGLQKGSGLLGPSTIAFIASFK